MSSFEIINLWLLVALGIKTFLLSNDFYWLNKQCEELKNGKEEKSYKTGYQTGRKEALAEADRQIDNWVSKCERLVQECDRLEEENRTLQNDCDTLRSCLNYSVHAVGQPSREVKDTHDKP